MAASETATGGLGKYRPIAEIGSGGMAQVFLALASGPAGFNKLLVIKQIREQFADDPEFLTMFLDEARLAARLNHPNVVQTNEVGQDGKRYFIAMEYLEGQPLNRILQRLGRTGALTLAMHIRIVIDALSGLHHAHELTDFDGTSLEVVHRDVTPHNIFVTYSGQVKVVDFGIAKALTSASETRTGVLKGKVAYMAPEQAMGERVDRRADIFAVGMILWEALAGRRLFKGVPEIAVLQKIVSGTLPSPRSIKPDIPAALEEICLKALAHDRKDRYSTAIELQKALEVAVKAIDADGSLRDVGQLVERHFEPERMKIKALVEAHLAGRRASGEFAIVDADRQGAGSAVRLPLLENPTSRDSMTSDGGTVGTANSRVSFEQTQPSSLISSLSRHPQAPAEAPLAPRNKTALAITAVVAIGAAVGVFTWLRGRSAIADGSAPPAAEQPVAHTMKIESSPPGALVTEGGRTLGKTPISLSLEAAQTIPRQFVVSQEGFAPYIVEQGPAREDVRVVVPLVAIPSAALPSAVPPAADASTVARAKVQATSPAAPQVVKAIVPTKTPPAPNLDINTVR